MKMSTRLLPLLTAVIVAMTQSAELLAQQTEPLFGERFANVFDPNSRTYYSLQGQQGDIAGQQPFTSFGASHFIGDIDDSISLFSGNIMVNNNGNPAGTFGAQQRWMTQLPVIDNSILGAGLYMDYTQSRYDNLFQQVNLNLELLTESSWVARFNGYFPVGRIQASSGIEQNLGGKSGQLSLIGDTVGFGGINRTLMDVGLMGTDFEFGRKFFDYRMEAYGGYYNWNGPLAGFTNGVKGGVRGYITNNLSGNVNISHDGFFGTNVSGGLTYFFGGSGGSRPMSFRNLMTLPAVRQQQVTIGNFTRQLSTFVPAHDSATGDVLHMYFVKEAGVGTGTRTNASNINSVLANTNFASGSAMVLLDENGNLTTPIALNHDRQQIIGGGSTGTADVDFSLALGQAPGTSVIHLSGLGGRPVLMPPSSNAVTLTNQNVVSGFTIDGAGGITNGIVGTPGASNTLVNDMIIRNVAGIGVKIQPSTNTTVSNTTFQNNGQDLLLNAANSKLTNITSTGAINGSLNLGGSGGDITGNTLISGVTITNAGGFGGILLNNAQNGSTTNLTNVTISNSSGSGLTVTNSQTGSIYNLTNVDILNVGGTGTLLQNSNGTFNVDATSSITNAGVAAFAIDGGAINVTNNSTINQSQNAPLLSVTNNHTGTVNFTAASTLSSNNGNGMQFNGANGTYNLLGTNSMTAGDAGIDILASTGTFVFNNPLINNTASGTGVNISGAAITTFNGLDITTNSGTGFKVVNGGLTSVNGTANVNATGQAAIDISGTPLAAVFTNVTSTGSATNGITLNNTSGTFGVSGLTSIVNATGSGITIQNSSGLTSTFPNIAISTTGSNGVTLDTAGIVNLTGGTIDGTAGDGIHSADTNLTATGLNIGGISTISGDGIEILNNSATSRTVNLSNNTIKANASGITTNDNGNSGNLLLTLNGNTLQSMNGGSLGLSVNGGGLNSTIIQSMNGGTVIGGTGGGVLFDQVTFDASGTALSGTQVNAGNWTIGTSGVRVQGDGLRFNAPTGDLKYGDLNIANNSGTGLYVDTKTLGTTFSLSNTSGSVDTTSGAALFLDPLTTNLTFRAVSSTNSSSNGVMLDTISGSLNINTLTVTGASANGLAVNNSSGLTSTFGTIAIDNIGADGVNLVNGGQVNILGGTINGTAGNGIFSADTNLTASNLNIGGTSTINGIGIQIQSTAGIFSDVTLSNNTIKSTVDAIATADMGTAGQLLLSLQNNILESTGGGGNYGLVVSGSGTNSTIINLLKDGTVVGHGTNGGVLFNRVTFDASGRSLSGTQVDGGNWTIGTTANRVGGHGLSFLNPTGDVKFGTINIANNAGTGLYVDTKSLGTTFSLSNTGGSVDTTNGSALFLDPLTTNLSFSSVTATGGSGNGIELDTVAGTVNLGTVNVTNMLGNGVVMNNSSASVTAGSVTVNNVASGLVFGNNAGGGFSATGVTNLTGLTGTGVDLSSAAGTYNFADLNITITGSTTGLDFRNSNVLFTSANTNITGNGDAGSIGIDLSGSTNPNGANSATPNITLAGQAGQTAIINNVGNGVVMGNVLDGSAGANFIYGNQTALNSGSQINAIASGLTLDTRHLISSNTLTQGQYNFKGVSFTGTASFQISPDYLFVGSSSAGGNTGSSVANRISLAELLALDANPANLDNKTIVLVNDNAGAGLNLGANTLVLGNNTILDSFGNGQTFTVGTAVPINVILDTVTSPVVITDPNGAATLKGSLDLVHLGDSNTVQNLILDGGLNGIVGSGIAGANINHLSIRNSSASGISLLNTTGTIGLNNLTLSNIGTGVNDNGITLQNAGGVTVTQSTIDSVSGNGIYSSNTDLTATNLGIGLTGTVSGKGIEVVNTGSQRTVDISDNIIIANGSAIKTTDVGVSGELLLKLDANMLQSNGGSVPALDVTGSGLNSTIVQSMLGGTIVGGAGGGAQFSQVTFDASGRALSGQQVVAGDWTIGTTGTRVQGDGLRLINPTGDLKFGALNIANNNGAGLLVNTKGLGTTFSLGNTSGTVDTTNGAALDLDPLTTNLTFGTVKSVGSSTVGVNVDTVAGTLDINNLIVSNSTTTGAIFNNSSGLTTTIQSVNITNTGSDGISLTSAGTFSVLGGTIDSTGSNGINSTDTSLTVSGVNIGPTSVAGSGIQITNTGNARTVNLTSNTIKSAGNALLTTDTGVAGELLMSLNGNSFESTGSLAVNVTGSGANSTIIQSMNGGTVVGNGLGGGALFQQVTFDASGVDLLGTQVQAGDWTIGTTTNRVSGDGLQFYDPTGKLAFGNLNVANNTGVGLTVNTKSLGTTFDLQTTGGTIDTTGGSALFLDPLSVNIHFNTVSSTGSFTNGATLDTVSGTVLIDQLNVSTANQNGLVINNSSGLTTTVTSMNINGVGNNLTHAGVVLTDAGTVNLNGGSIDNSTGDGIHSSDTNLTATSLLIGNFGSIAGDGIEIVNNGGLHTVNLSGNTIIGAASGITTKDSGLTVGELLLTLDNNTLSSVDVGSKALEVLGNGLNTTIIRSMNGGMILANGTGGGAHFSRVTFDGSGRSLSGTQAVAGDWTVGTGVGVSGDGMRFDGPSGNLQFGDLTIKNAIGTGLFVDTKTLGTTFALGNTSGSITTTGGAALNLDPLAVDMTFSTVTSTNSSSSGVILDTVSGNLNLGSVSVTNATSRGLSMTDSSAAVTASSVTVNGATDGLVFGNNLTGSFTVSGTTNLTGITENGVDLTGATGSYQFADLTVGMTGAATGLNFRNSNVTFQSANTSITGDGTAGSIGIDLSGSQNPNGANSTTPNIQLGNAGGQTALINNVGTGVRLGSVADGSAGANFIYGNQTPLNSGSQINVIVGGLTLDAANLVSTGAYTQGRYEFKGVSFTGNTNFASAPGASYIFVGQTSDGAADGSTPTDRYSIAQLIALGSAALNNKTVVLVNEGVNIDEGASTLTLGNSTIVDTFGNGRSFTTAGLIIPQNVVVDTFGGAVTYNDPFSNGAATLTGTNNVITLGNNDTVQNILISGGTNGITGTGISNATINNVNISGSSQNGINLVNTTGTQTLTALTIDSVGTNGINLSNAGSVSISGTTSINNTGADGIHSSNTNLTIASAAIGTTGAITGDGIVVNNTDATSRTFSISNSNLGTALLDIGSRGIVLSSTGAGTLTANLNGTPIFSSGAALLTTDSGTAKQLVLNIGTTGNMQFVRSSSGFAVDITGSGLNSTIVQSLGATTSNINVGGTANGGGVRFNRVTFDGSGTALSGSTTNTGNWTIGTAGARVQGDGLRFDGPSGSLLFNSLDVANNNGTGIYVDTKTLGTSFSLATTNPATVNTANGSALFLDPLTVNMTFDSVSSTNSGTNGVWLDGVSGNFTVNGTTTSTNAGGHGILIENSEGTFNFNDIDVNTPGADGIHINNTPAATINFNGTTTIQSTTGDGIDLSSAGGGVTFGTTNISGAGADGINLTNATGSYAFGGTTINGFEATSVGINFAGAAADATFGVTDIGNGGVGTAIDLSSTTGNHTISFATGSNIHNVALGVELSSSHTNATSANATFAFGDSNAGNGLGSFINATTTVNAIGLNPLSGTYNFDDVSFTGTASLPSSSSTTLFVSATATNGAGDGSFGNPYSVSDADAITTAGKTFVFLDGTYDFNTLNGGNAFTLSKNQNVEGLDNGHTVAYGTAQPTNVSGNLGGTSGTASRTSSLLITDSAAGGVFDLLGGNSLLDITISGSAATTYLVGANGGAGGFDNTAGINLNGVTMSNAAGSATAMQFTNLTGSMTATGNNINLSAGRLLDIDGGTATYSLTRGTQPDVGSTPGVLTAESMRVRNTTGGSVSLNGATLSTTSTLMTLDNNDATFTFANNTFSGGAGSTLFDIDTTTGGSTTALTFDNTNTITQTQGRIANIGGGARNFDLSAFNFTNTGTTAANVINSVGQTGGTISFGTINIAGFNNAAGTAVNLQGSGGSATFGDLDIVTTNGAGLSVGAITFNGGASPTVNANGGTALNLNGTTLFGGSQTFDITATNAGVGNAGININNVVGNTVLSLVSINGTGAEGILINNSGQVNIGGGAGTSFIDGTVGDAVKTTNTSTFVDTVNFGSLAAIGGNGYTALMSNGVNHTLDITNSGFNNISGKGVSVTNSGAGNTVFTMTSTGVNSADNAGDFRKTGAGALDVGLGNNAFTSSTGFGLYVDGSAGAGILSVTSNSQNTTNGATGGQIFETVTFDANTSLAGIQQVAGGATTIASISGDGLRLNNVLGDLAFTTLNITNDNGTGLYIRDAAGKGGSFSFSNTGGTITTTNGAAMDIDPVTMNSTFATVSSTNANGQGISNAANGINLNTVSGTVTINGGSITGAQGTSFVVTGGDALVTYSGDITATTASQAAVLINGGNTGTVTFDTGTISATNGTGLQFSNADGTYNFNGTTTLNGGDAGIDIFFGSAGTFAFGTGTTITSPTGNAFDLTNSTADVTYSGNITQANNASLVSISNESAGTVTFNTGTLSASNGSGIDFINVDGNVNFNGTTTLTGGSVIDIENNSDGTFVFGTGTSITNGTSDAFRYGNGAGNVTYNGNITQTVATNGLVFITGQTGGTITFQNGTLSGSAGTGMAFNNVDGNVNFLGTTSLTDSQIGIGNNSAGTFNFGSGTSLTNSGGLIPFTVANSSANITYSGNLTHSNVTTAGISIQNESAGTITFNTGTIGMTNGTGIQLDNVDSIVNFNGTTTLNGGDAGVDIINGSAGTITFGSGTSITNPTGVAFNEDTSTANVTYNGTITKNNNSQNTVKINAKTGGTTALNGQITASTSTGNAINLTSNTGGVINFNNTSGSTSNITTTSGTAFNFTGGGTMNLVGNNYVFNSTSGTTFNATAGTVSAIGTGNTLTSTTGTALNVNGATIGVGDLTFKSISANGATNGIILNNTGALGGLIVTGNGNTSVGGDGSGGLIQNTTGAGISLTNTRDVSLTNLNISNTGGSGIDGTDVTNFTYNNGTITGAGNAGTESAIAFNQNPTTANNIDGTLTIDKNIFTNAFYSGVDVQSGDGTVTNATITNNTITNPGFSGVNFAGTGSVATVFNLTKALIDNNTITGSGGNGVQINIGNNAGGTGAIAGIAGDASNKISITNNTVSLDTTGTNAIVINNAGGNSGSRDQTNFDVSFNTLGSSSIGTVILIGNNGYSTMTGTVTNNTITATHTVNGGGGNGIGGGNGAGSQTSAATPDLTLTVENNTISGTDGNGILLVGRGATGIARFKIDGNNVGAPVNTTTGRPGIRIDAGNGSSVNDSVYLNIFNNTSAGSNAAAGIGVRKEGSNISINDFGLYDAAGGPSLNALPSNADIQAFINALNPAGNGTLIINGSNYSRDTTQAPP